MNHHEAEHLRASFRWFAPCGPAMIAKVTRNLSDSHPGVRALFPEETDSLNVKAFRTLGQIVENAEKFHRLEEPLGALGRRCAQEGANPAHYAIVRDELITVMAELAGDDWSESLEHCWRMLLDAATGAMLAGAAEERMRRAA